MANNHICRTSPRSTLWLLKAVWKTFTMSSIFCVSAVLYLETRLWIKSQTFLFVVGMQVISPMPSLSSCSVRRSYISFIASLWTTTDQFLCLLSLLYCVARGCWCSSNSCSIISVRNSCADLVLIVIFQKMPLLRKWTDFASKIGLQESHTECISLQALGFFVFTSSPVLFAPVWLFLQVSLEESSETEYSIIHILQYINVE